MPKRRKTPDRPRDVNQLAKLIVDISTGQAEDAEPEPRSPRSKRAAKAAAARAEKLSAKRRRAIARKAATGALAPGPKPVDYWRMPSLRPAFSTKLGAVYQANCLDLLAALRSDVIDTVFADPPFNIGKDYGNGSHHDRMGESEYLAWCSTWIRECVRVLQPGGAFFLYHLPQQAYRLAAQLEANGMTFRHWIALAMKGTFPRGRKLYPAHYALLYFTKGDPKTFNRVRLPVPACRHCGKDLKDYGGHRKYLNPLGLNLTDFWDDTSPARHSTVKARWHVNELKPKIPGRCIEMSTNAGEVVLDPFGGGGSTYQAAEEAGRNWLGTEIVDCSLIADRFERLSLTSKKGPPPLAAKFTEPKPGLAIQTCPESLRKSISTAHANGSNGSGSRRSLVK